MKISYNELNFSQKTLSDILFFKNNHIWYFLSPKKKSRFFGGYLFYNERALKFLDEIDFKEEILETQILSYKDTIIYFRNNQAYFTVNPDSLEITFSNPQEISIFFDIKDIFENQPFKRKISFEIINSNIILVNEFLEGIGYIKLLIESDAPLNFDNQWIEKNLDFDLERNSPPYNWYVYYGISGKIRKIKIKITHPKLNNINKKIFNLTQIPLIDFLLLRIESLVLNNYLPAGFPWFFENWYRDELLSLFLLKKFLKQEFIKERLNFYLENLENIWNKNKNLSTLESSDTLLLLILNINEDLFLINFKILEKYISLWEKKFIKENELNLPDYSTWMDTISRKKAVEILALYLLALRKFANFNKSYVEKANYFKEKLKKEVLQNLDSNLVFVYLFLKGIFTQNKWQIIFENLLKNFYLDWGGVSTLAKNDPNFKEEDDGEKASAYHQGDSWYYLNNLYASALYKINYKKFSNEVNQIIKSSLIDLLLDGALGFSSEVSSAKERKSQNSLVQLWSMASLTYLLSSLKNINISLESLCNSHNIISIKP